MRGETATNFYTAVNEGRGEMPGYNGTLSSDEIWDIVFYVIGLSTEVDLLDAGMEIYDENCASCHGEEGSGDLLGSADFSDLQQMADLAPRDLYLSITQGSGSMPAWQSLLSQDDRWAVIDYVRTFHYDPILIDDPGSVDASGEQATEIPTAACDTEQENPVGWNDAVAISAGEAVYEGQCAICHGADATGGLPNTPDFTTPEYTNSLKENPGGAFCVLSEGEGAMPAFEDKLTQEELWQVMVYFGALSP
jgi:mono/diheme cytochrome c family protein